jgi:hypothetical protein
MFLLWKKYNNNKGDLYWTSKMNYTTYCKNENCKKVNVIEIPNGKILEEYIEEERPKCSQCGEELE